MATPFRLLDKEIQRNFALRFPGFSGMTFNKLFSKHVCYDKFPDVNDLMYDWYFVNSFKGISRADMPAKAQALIELFTAAVRKGEIEERKRQIRNEAAGLITIEQAEERFWFLQIGYAYKKISVRAKQVINWETRECALDWNRNTVFLSSSDTSIEISKEGVYDPKQFITAYKNLVEKNLKWAQERLAILGQMQEMGEQLTEEIF